ncbi:UNVERIFIED_ORG: hypothetical protein ABIC54_000538 [Burkholderia sp. 1263]
MNAKNLRHMFAWYLACGLNRVQWQHTVAIGLLTLWALTISAIDLPLREETRDITSQLGPHLALEPAKPGAAEQRSTPQDPTREFAASLPKFEKYSEQLRALNVLADQAGVVITRIDYRYEHMPALPIRKLTLHMDIRGDEARQRRFLLTTLNAFANLSVARLAYVKSTDGPATFEQKLDVNLYYQSRPKAAA